mmetsp:Transcript_28591/g.87484  ORF Transcript_28591/g.87484 Transcript_28591/m.87484 type:complete len:213 (+) Transcript_28591:38-676(+)
MWRPDAGRDSRLTLMVNNRRVPSRVSTRPRLSSAPLVAVISADSPRAEESSLVPISDNVSSRQAHGESPPAMSTSVPLPPLDPELEPPPRLDFTRSPPSSPNRSSAAVEIEPLFADVSTSAAASKEFALYTRQPITIPSRSRGTFSVRLPLEVIENYPDSAILVDRLPPRDGLDSPPMVATSVETPTPEGEVLITVWNLAPRPVTLPAYSPV